MMSNIAPLSVLMCGVLGLAILCLAILRMAVLEHRQHVGRRRVSPAVQLSRQRPKSRDKLVA